MRPASAPLHVRHPRSDDEGLRAVAMASFVPRGAHYDPRVRLKRSVVAIRGGEDAIVIAFGAVREDSQLRVRVKVAARGACTTEDVERAIEIARGMSAVDDDPSDFFAMVKDHPVIGPLARTNDPRMSKTPTVFESYAVATIEQLVTGFEAREAIRRLWRIAGESVPRTKLVAAPTAAAVRRVPMWKMHEMGIGSRRAATLREGALRGDALERLRDSGTSPADAIERLQSLPGIGPWTANAIAKSAFGYADAIPVGDFHGPFVIAAALGGPKDLTLDDRPAADRAMIEVLEPFRPHRGRVALLLEGSTTKKGWRPPKVDPHRREPWKY